VERLRTDTGPVQCWAVFVERWPVHHGIAGAARPCGVSAAVPETGLDRLAPAWGLSDTGVCFRNVKAGGPAQSEAIKRGIARASLGNALTVGVDPHKFDAGTVATPSSMRASPVARLGTAAMLAAKPGTGNGQKQ